MTSVVQLSHNSTREAPRFSQQDYELNRDLVSPDRAQHPSILFIRGGGRRLADLSAAASFHWRDSLFTVCHALA
jgi:hypothetical protein